MLIPLIPCNYDTDGLPSPSYIEARRSKVGLGQEKSDKNTHILTFNTIKLLHSPFPQFLLNQSSIHCLNNAVIINEVYPIDATGKLRFL